VFPDADKGGNVVTDSPLDPATRTRGEAQFSRDEIPAVVAPHLSDVPGIPSLPRRMSLAAVAFSPHEDKDRCAKLRGSFPIVHLCMFRAHMHTKCSMICLCQMIVTGREVEAGYYDKVFQK
jgi:hypothetical protein